MGTYSFRLLGAFEAHYGDAPVRGLDKARPRNLLAYLLLHRDRELTRHGLADLIWPDSTESQARTNLRNLVHRLRSALPDPDALISVNASQVGVRPDARIKVDVEELERLVDAIDQRVDASDDALRELEAAAALCRGSLLPACRDEWVFPLRERLQRTAVEVADDLAREYERRRDLRGAIRVSREVLAHDATNESLHRRLVRLLAADGDRAGALRAYHACAEALASVGAAPNEATEALVAQLRSGAVQPTPANSREVPFVGRLDEWSALTELVSDDVGGGPRVVTIHGEAGLGKTRLAEELTRWARRQGIATAGARCYSAEGRVAYAPACELLRRDAFRSAIDGLDDGRASELSRILPELREHRGSLAEPGPLDQDWQRTRFFEAMTHVARGAGRPIVVVIDDVQWCDRSTLEWLHHLLRRGTTEDSMLLVLTERDGEAPRPDLRALEADLARDGRWTRLRLQRLSNDHALELASSLVPEAQRAARVGALCEEAEGNPLFLVELARSADEQTPDEGRALPERLQRVIAGRLARLSDDAVALARVVAVIAGDAAWELLASASELPEDALTEALDELWERGVLSERGAGAYGFGHDKIREAVDAALPPGRRRRLHGQVADALEMIAGPAREEWSRIAAHREAAGQLGPASAAHLRAAKSADAIFAIEAAMEHLRRGLSLGGAAVDSQGRADANVRLAELLMRSGEPDEARATVRAAIASDDSAPIDRARLLRCEGLAFTSRNRYPEAFRSLDEAEAALDGLRDASLAHRRVWVDLQLTRMQSEYWRGNAAAIATLAEGVEAEVEQYGSPTQQSGFHLCLVSMFHRRDRYVGGAATLEHAEAALEAARDSGDRAHFGEMLFNLGFAQLWSGELDAARRSLDDSAALAVEIGDVWLELRVQTYLAFLTRRTRDPALKEHIERSEALATRTSKAAYAAVARAHRAAVALRQGDPERAVALAAAARQTWDSSPIAYPFQWCGVLVELAAFVDAGCPAADAAASSVLADRLRQPSQQRLPPSIDDALERRAFLDAVTAARASGYL